MSEIHKEAESVCDLLEPEEGATTRKSMVFSKLLLLVLALTVQKAQSLAQSPLLRRIAVAGATGKTGSLVVQELLRRNFTSSVVAMVRDDNKARQLFPAELASSNSKLQIVKCDFTDEQDIARALDGVDAAVWCATGFTYAPVEEGNFMQKLKQKLFNQPAGEAPKISIDAVGIQAIANCFSNRITSTAVNGDDKTNSNTLPRIVMLSSAGVTRPTWDEATKQQFVGAADIPIVRLNPSGILDIKRESEERLRQSGASYCIVRPCGLNDKWPAGSRPVFSQGDVACGLINRADVAQVLVDVLTEKEATGKTFEMMSLAGYPKADTIATALSRLVSDKQPLGKEAVAATYAALQQLLPGERQASAELAMGQTYEQKDRGETGRLGERGKENLDAVGLRPSS